MAANVVTSPKRRPGVPLGRRSMRRGRPERAGRSWRERDLAERRYPRSPGWTPPRAPRLWRRSPARSPPSRGDTAMATNCSLRRTSAEGSAETSAAQPFAVPRSAATPRTAAAPGTAARSRATAMSTASCLRPLSTTAAPARAKPVAMAKPMPPVEPVTAAVLPERSMFMPASRCALWIGASLPAGSCATITECVRPSGWGEGAQRASAPTRDVASATTGARRSRAPGRR
jgi:hypothetical protein